MVGRFLGFIYLIFLVTELKATPNLKAITENKENYPWTARMRFTFFQVINPLEVVTGVEMAKFEERGPYTYREVLEKRNQVQGDSTVQFEQYRHFEFDAAQSCEGCLKTDTVRILNQPLIGAVAGAMAQGGGLVTGIALGILAGVIQNTADSPDLFLVDSVDNILFAGVNNELVEELLTNSLLKNKLPPAIQDNGFAIFNTKNGSTHNSCFEVSTSDDRYFEIEKWGADLENLVPDLSTTRTCPSTIDGSTPACKPTEYDIWWPYPDTQGNVEASSCNNIKGFTGEYFPSLLENEMENDLKIYANDICGTMTLKYSEDVDVAGTTALRFTLQQESVNVNRTDNFCACKELAEKWDTDCYKTTQDSAELDITDCGVTSCHDGLKDVSGCMLSPVIMSAPHFHLAENQLNNFDPASGLTPDPSLHGTYLDIEPVTGMTLSYHKRFQVNMPIVPTGKSNIVFLENIKPVPAFPVLWFDEEFTAV